MRRGRLAGGAAALLLCAAPLRAEPFLAIDVAKACADPSLPVDAGRVRASCRRQEREAQGRLRALWPRLTAAERALCLGVANLGVARSYTEVVGCIDTARELGRERGLPGAVVPRGPNAMR